MEKIKENQEVILKFIWGFLFLNPFLDVFTSFSNHYLGRSLYVVLFIKVFFLLFLFIECMKKFDKKIFLYCLLLFFYCLLFLGVQYSSKGSSILLMESQNLFRTFYFPLSFTFLLYLEKQNRFEIKRSQLVLLLILYLCFLVVPSLLGVGFNSYAHSKTGNIGWFYSTNEIGGILAILGPFLFVVLKNKKWFVQVLLFIFYLLGILILGTKVPILALVIIIFSFLILFYRKLFLKKEWKKIIVSVIGTLLCSIVLGFVVVQSSFYKNIQIHLDFLGIHQVQDLFTFHHIDHFIFSERLSFLENTHEIYSNQSLSSKIVGMGITVLEEENPVSMKMIEMDYFDVFYHYGVIGLLLFLLPFFLFYQKRKYQFDEIISMILILLLAFFSGHILIAPSVSVLVSLILIPKKEVLK